jgi:hypothetical protein
LSFVSFCIYYTVSQQRMQVFLHLLVPMIT